MTTRQPAAERPPLAGAARTWLTLFPFAVAMHNTEELPNMQRWVQNAVDNGYPRAFDPAFYQPTRLWVPMILIDLLVAAATGAALVRWNRATRFFALFMTVGFALNAAGHFALTIGFGYNPGVITAVVFTLPVTAGFLVTGLRTRLVSWPQVLLAAAAFAVAFGPLVAALLRLGRLIPEVIA